MKDDEAQRIIESAAGSVGMPAADEERDVIRCVAREALHVRASIAFTITPPRAA